MLVPPRPTTWSRVRGPRQVHRSRAASPFQVGPIRRVRWTRPSLRAREGPWFGFREEHMAAPRPPGGVQVSGALQVQSTAAPTCTPNAPAPSCSSHPSSFVRTDLARKRRGPCQACAQSRRSRRQKDTEFRSVRPGKSPPSPHRHLWGCCCSRRRNTGRERRTDQARRPAARLRWCSRRLRYIVQDISTHCLKPDRTPGWPGNRRRDTTGGDRLRRGRRHRPLGRKVPGPAGDVDSNQTGLYSEFRTIVPQWRGVDRQGRLYQGAQERRMTYQVWVIPPCRTTTRQVWPGIAVP